ncbi:MAG: pyridoxamine 5'-phosphate oxidase family protein [Chloroflexota bacterium]|nr:pyridoxamine 5'-phosphate oxidase family protein [Chloroflexota bacterium]
MIANEPVAVETYHSGDNATPTPWAEAATRLETPDRFWLATMRSDGTPHAVPILAVWVNDALQFVAPRTSLKAANVAGNPRCVVTTNSQGLDLAVKGEVAIVQNEAQLRQVAAVYESKYSWPVDIRDGACYAEGAPTAGLPPFDIYNVSPSTAFGFGDDVILSPTRWRF